MNSVSPIIEPVNFSELHTFALKGLGRANVMYIKQVNQAIDMIQDIAQGVIIGGGSNTIFIENYCGNVIVNDIQGIVVEESEHHFNVSVGAGTEWHFFVEWLLAQGINGLENLALIPGTVGAAPVQNIGAYGVELERFCHMVEYVDLATGELKRLDNRQCEFGYRDSVFKGALKDKAFITRVVFSFPKQWQPELSYGPLQSLSSPSALDIFNKVVEIRQAKLPDPNKVGNAGSFFKNPIINLSHWQKIQQAYPDAPHYVVEGEEEAHIKIPAAWLIDQLGFKGKQVGDIQCNPTQPLVLTNLGEGTPEQLITLAKQIQSQVRLHFDIELQPEVRFIASNGEVELNHE